MKGEPIPVDCEGSGQPPAGGMVAGQALGAPICVMCGQFVSFVEGGAVAHQRDDLLARIERGDFDEA